MALEALAKGFRTVLVLEDDALFARRVTPRTVPRGRPRPGRPAARLDDLLPRALAGAGLVRAPQRPAHGLGLRPRLRREPAALGVAAPPPLRHRPDRARLAGVSVDAAYAALPGAYAYFPMLAVQSDSPSDHMPHQRGQPVKKLRHLISRSAKRELLQSRLMRPTELAVAALSPLFWLVERSWGPLAAAGDRARGG